MFVEIPIVCQGNDVLTRIGSVDTGKPGNTIRARVEMVELCGRMGRDNRCEITGENCILKPRKVTFDDGIGDGDEEVID
ncbi:MAG: hypothetical protein US68_C0006G0088 [Candidatus Shapirobacteria bacterium GW2011_GWE1_38_10]|uniref:Uncharacterized protein n=1 Tax=Candidatus Shapirobacteria bacterium GW2011_GWE1_38_10 TaxID=1618488 RepID=A0A0G0I4Z4_9BACT|nr:MAG: hypothetical protein US46_C0002G0091 [Candidatus Shapirobacteria bacterium GW2011_GWF2_37_20]KKQ50408.1 MAG: hypothetical protein US68_C0006G0088 [Candidatus Shapirobacteria bacterium GW2011_GWE1_38_10]KKQ65232.1 MAG: hypothetical protein US85_C0001G0159 [Candidatus Shapirobacteria bacterium GW2011_GWF1_38_23]HBP51192.1 hypothetical protein [Candidatus Shapirobacteria bacterium]